MTMSLADVRTMVRNISDLDATDVPNSIIDDAVKEAFQRIIALERRYPRYQETYTFNTVIDQRAYTIATIGDIREIISLVDTSSSGSRLTMIPYDNAEEIWLGNTDTASRPYFYALWDAALHLYANLMPCTRLLYARTGTLFTRGCPTHPKQLTLTNGSMFFWLIMLWVAYINVKKTQNFQRCTFVHLKKV